VTIIVAVVNLKGGSTKTTVTGHLLHAFQAAGQRTIGIDADGENESLQKWQVAADWEISVVGLAVPNLHKQLPGVIGDRYDVVCIDTPPMREQRGIVRSAMQLATHIIVPMAPTSADYERLPQVRALIDEATDLRTDGVKPVTAVMFNRVNPNPRTASTSTYRQLITEDGWTVLAAQVAFADRYAQAVGDPVTRVLETPFGAAVDELLDLEVTS
jgi:chromosome partitioning protein